ncbi:MAG: divergent polysaccharide deacetylase family protein [Treponema sp.]|jgi:polysaccharide deacetylase 2 family uncharacterized protein YibQ|nr:divergent polysaccharide deacetylase family protein [Treponema sp.]
MSKKVPSVKKGALPAKDRAPHRPKRVKRRRRIWLSFVDCAQAVILAGVCIIAATCIGIIVYGITRSAEEILLVETAPAAAVLPPDSSEPVPQTAPPALPEAAPATPPPANPQGDVSKNTAPEAPPRANPQNRVPKPAPPQSLPVVPEVVVPKPAISPSRPVEQPPRPAPKHRGTLIWVIDDAGNNLRELEPFLRFPGPLTIAVLPGLPYSAEAARRIRAAGKEVILHQPMEALGGENPGPGALYSGMDDEEIRRIVNRNIDEIGPVAGLNNHQGSKITGNEEAMEVILELCRERGIFFLDSRTTADTAAPNAAKKLGIKIGERDVFLDNVQEKTAMVNSVEAGLVRAENRGQSVMIGHTWSSELAEVLTSLYPKLIEQGYTFSTVSRYMKGIN